MRQSTKRLLSMFVSLFLVVGALVIYLDFIKPAYNYAEDLYGQNLSKQNFVNDQKQAVNQVQNLINAYQGQGELQQAVSQSFPVGDDTPGALNQLVGLAGASSLSLSSLSVNTETAGPKNSAPSAGLLAQPAGTIIFNLKLSGSYGNLKSFIRNLETNVKIFDLKTLKIQALAAVQVPGKQPLDLYGLDLALATYYQIPQSH